MLFRSIALWGSQSETVARRWALMFPTTISIFIAPFYLSTTDPTMYLIQFMLMICFVGGKDALNPGWLAERYPTEVRATAAGFVYHQGAVWGAFVAPTLTYFAVNQQMGFAMPMLYATVGSLVVYVIAVFLGPETKGMQMTSELQIFEREENP
jgi:SHS family lactate transporter-like MFS transporter